MSEDMTYKIIQAVETIGNLLQTSEVAERTDIDTIREAFDLLINRAHDAIRAERQRNEAEVGRDRELAQRGAAEERARQAEKAMEIQRNERDGLKRLLHILETRLAFAEGFIANRPKAFANYAKSSGKNLMAYTDGLNNRGTFGIQKDRG